MGLIKAPSEKTLKTVGVSLAVGAFLGGVYGFIVGWNTGEKASISMAQMALEEAIASGRIMPGPAASETMRNAMEASRQLRNAILATHVIRVAEIVKETAP